MPRDMPMAELVPLKFLLLTARAKGDVTLCLAIAKMI